MADAGPDWAITAEMTASGDTVFRDESGARLVALAVTAMELDLLIRCVAERTSDEGASELLDRLRLLQDDLR